jgi:heme oxygenase
MVAPLASPAPIGRRREMIQTYDKVINGKLGLLELGKQLGHMSQACKMMGSSGDSFYRFTELYETGAFAGLDRFDQEYFPTIVAKVREENRIEFNEDSNRLD